MDDKKRDGYFLRAGDEKQNADKHFKKSEENNKRGKGNFGQCAGEKILDKSTRRALPQDF